MLKVLHISDGLGNGGKERQMIELFRLIDKARFQIGLITFNQGQHYEEHARQLADFFSIVQKRPTRLEPFFLIWKQINAFKPDIIHVWDSLSAMYAYLPCKILKIKCINGSIRDAGIEKGIHFLLKRFFLKQYNLVISNSVAGLNAYRTDGEVIYNSINPSRFIAQSGTSKFNLVMVASFSDYKDQRTFIDATAILLSENIADTVFLVGDGKNRIYYIQYVQDKYPQFSSRFVFTGSVAKVEEILADCRIGILCSTKEYGEGVSNAVLEYMAAGLVPIASNVGGNPEIIKHGYNGFLVDEKDINAIGNIIQKIKVDEVLQRSITQNARLTILEKFSHKENIKKLEDIYISLMK